MAMSQRVMARTVGEPVASRSIASLSERDGVVGAEVLRYYSVTGYWIPGIHSRPLSDVDPDIAPELVPLRERLMAMVGRPVNIQGTRDWVQSLRAELMGQPYLILFGSVEGA